VKPAPGLTPGGAADSFCRRGSVTTGRPMETGRSWKLASLRCSGSRCTMMTKAAPVRAGSASKNPRGARTPSAEAPMATITGLPSPSPDARRSWWSVPSSAATALRHPNARNCKHGLKIAGYVSKFRRSLCRSCPRRPWTGSACWQLPRGKAPAHPVIRAAVTPDWLRGEGEEQKMRVALSVQRETQCGRRVAASRAQSRSCLLATAPAK
jgi:hypothetical protein